MSVMPVVVESRPPSSNDEKDNPPLLEKFSERRSKELVIAFAGPIGCGIASVINLTEEQLRQSGYTDVVRIKLSDFLEQALKEGRINAQSEESASTKFNRYRRLQLAGMDLRHQTVNAAILAEYAIQKIVTDRTRRSEQVAVVDDAIEGVKPMAPGRIAYLIDQIKRPEEVILLRAVYRNLFYLVGVTRIYAKRLAALEDEGLTSKEAPSLMEIDRNEIVDDGQRLDKTLHLADYFLRNNIDDTANKKEKISRFLRVIHGDKSITPTNNEHGMYTAYAAGLRSACLSRQVGAAIASESGEIISTGCNDVPKPGGGLYSVSSEVPDNRCVHLPDKLCFNDLYKKKLQEEIGSVIDQFLKRNKFNDTSITLEAEQRKVLLKSIYENTRLGSLIEFSRSVHAEMDAIVSLARNGGIGIKGAILYTTTFPCHSCARHIVAAGISKVFYIEPYEKSLARELHKDAIAFENEANSDQNKAPSLVQFLHFEGIAPRQFQNVFLASDRKSKEGKFLEINLVNSEKTLPEYLDNYQSFEVKVVEHFTKDLEKVPSTTKVEA
ncbi:MAG: anti-phage dCTP deaminase [Pseudomonadota bacterium]